MNPVVEAVSISPAHAFSKRSQPFIRLIAGEGVEGDAHRGTTTQHLYLKRRDPLQPNLCQVHLLAAEMLDELAARGFHLNAGDLGENILTRHLDLLSLPQQTELHIGDAVLQVTGLRTPCSRIDAFQRGLQRNLWGPRNALGMKARRAGIMSIVLQGGEVRAGDRMRVELPPQPHLCLKPV